MGGRSYPRYKKFTVYYYLKTTGITKCILFVLYVWGCCGHDCMVVQQSTTCAISAYHHKSCELEPRSWRGGTQYNIKW